jgi:Asp/Glu/hydantoin racemase
MGASFSLINVNPKFTNRIVEGVKASGLGSRMVSIERLTVERPGAFDAALRDADAKAEIVRQFLEAARRGLDKGAEVIIPAGGSLMAILTAAGVHQVESAPVLNGIIALIKTAELAVQMRRITGMFTSKRMIYAPPTGKLLEDVRTAYGPHVYPGAS